MYITHESYMYRIMFVNYYVTLIRACINYLFSGSTTYTVFLYLKTILLCIRITIAFYCVYMYDARTIHCCGQSIRWVNRTCYLYRYTNCLRRGKTVNLAYNPVSPVYIEYLNGERKRDSLGLVLDPITKNKVNTKIF